MQIRRLDPVNDLERVFAFYRDAPDYWLLAEGAAPDMDKARAFFTDCPPHCDPAASERLGLFVDGRLSGVAELSFGWPAAGDAFLGLMILGPWLRGQGYGPRFLDHADQLARQAGSPALYLAVLEENPRGRAFWDRMGFRPTGVSATWEVNGLTRTAHRLVRPF